MISNRCHYALRAMLELAKREGRGLCTIAEIAEARDIPARFLESILLQLKQSGLARSVRGKDGGYALARPPGRITVGEIMRIFEGPMLAASPAGGGKQPRSKRAAGDVFGEVWQRAEKALSQVFNDITFAELAERDKLRASHAGSDYVI